MDDYWMGRDKEYPLALDTQTIKNAEYTVRYANEFLILAKGWGVKQYTHPKNNSAISSGWRPPVVNAATKGASKTSLHMTGLAVDLYDPEQELDKFAMRNQQVLKDLGLWLEHPNYTPNWCHVQLKPPRSGNRVFIPY